MSSNSTHSANQTGKDVGNSIKAGIAGIHGVGEAIRGNINSAIDQSTNDTAGVAKNDAIAQKGEREMDTGHLERERTKRI